MKLNIACGFNQKKDYINIDKDPRTEPDIIRDIERGLPFSDNSVDEIISEHTLEHISPDLIHFVMYEFWRVLKKGGRLKVIVPINMGWLNSPEHKCPFSDNSVVMFTDWNDRHPYRYKLIYKEILFLDEKIPSTQELHFELEVVK